MRLEIGIPCGCRMSSRFCWVCGMIGRTNGGWLYCDRHPEGMIKWAVYEVPIRLQPNVGRVYL